MDYEKLKKRLIETMNINEKTMHVLSMGSMSTFRNAIRIDNEGIREDLKIQRVI